MVYQPEPKLIKVYQYFFLFPHALLLYWTLLPLFFFKIELSSDIFCARRPYFLSAIFLKMPATQLKTYVTSDLSIGVGSVPERNIRT
jgi:hypothetical protein